MIFVKRHIAFFLALAALLAEWSYVTFSTLNAPASDGSILAGFPLPFYSEGGMCMEGYCKPHITYSYLFTDLILSIPFPFGVQTIYDIFRKAKTL